MGPAWPARSTPPPCPRDSATPTSAATPTPGNAWDQQGWTHAITQLGIEAYFDAAASRRDVFSYEAVAIDPGDVHRRERSIEVFRARRAPSHSSLAQTQATGSPSTRPRPPGGPALGVRVGAGYQRCDPASGSTGTGAAARSRCWRRALFRCCRIRHGWSAVWSALLVPGQPGSELVGVAVAQRASGGEFLVSDLVEVAAVSHGSLRNSWPSAHGCAVE